MKPLSLAVQELQTDSDVMFGTRLITEKLMLKGFDEYAKLVAKAYQAAPASEPGAMPHWQALMASTAKLFKRIAAKVHVEFVTGQPYPDAETMTQQVKQSGKLLISKDFNEHSVFSPELNLQFRAVHDYITHIVCHQPFGVKGEIQAYNRHVKLAPAEAVPALFTEIVGQACTAVVTGSFPPQKIAILRGFDYRRIGVVAGHDIKDKTLVPDEQPVKSVQPPAKPVPKAPAIASPTKTTQPAAVPA